MSRKRDRPNPRARRSPTATVADMSDAFFDELYIPELPMGVPQRLESAIKARIEALLYQLKEARREKYIKAIEVRLVREAHRAVLTAHELKLGEAEVFYASFRKLVEELGYERADVGFVKASGAEPAPYLLEDD